MFTVLFQRSRYVSTVYLLTEYSVDVALRDVYSRLIMVDRPLLELKYCCYFRRDVHKLIKFYVCIMFNWSSNKENHEVFSNKFPSCVIISALKRLYSPPFSPLLFKGVSGFKFYSLRANYLGGIKGRIPQLINIHNPLLKQQLVGKEQGVGANFHPAHEFKWAMKE